ncbi:hypothetical protein Taro_013964 [Colocasia esculenta]|uniref:Uncharacterized protein n=1 Tax=Colocasia esculenta TaxID=4460 RepID=A0A843UHM4_COLES|nr:hypothetical protein [Colocasia esculenta]
MTETLAVKKIKAFYFTARMAAFHSTVRGLLLSQITTFYFTARVAAFYSTVGETAFNSTVRGLLLSQITAFYFTARVAAFYSTVGETAFNSIVRDIDTICRCPHRCWLFELIGTFPFCNPLPVRPRAALVGLHCLNDVDLLGMWPSSASIVTLAYLMMTSAAWACRCQLQRSLPTKDGKDQMSFSCGERYRKLEQPPHNSWRCDMLIKTEDSFHYPPLKNQQKSQESHKIWWNVRRLRAMVRLALDNPAFCFNIIQFQLFFVFCTAFGSEFDNGTTLLVDGPFLHSREFKWRFGSLFSCQKLGKRQDHAPGLFVSIKPWGRWKLCPSDFRFRDLARGFPPEDDILIDWGREPPFLSGPCYELLS